MRTIQPNISLPRRKPNAVVVASAQRRHQIMGTVILSLAGATIAMLLAYLPWVTTQLLIQLRVLPL